MCKNVTSQASNLMIEIRSSVVAIMGMLNVPAATQTQVLATFDAAQEALANWVPGTTGKTVIEALQAFTAIFQSLSTFIPPELEILEGIISGGIAAVIALVDANSTADPVAQAQAASEGIAKVEATIPGFKLGVWDKARAARGDEHVAANHYKSEWNNAVKKAGGKYESLKR